MPASRIESLRRKAKLLQKAKARAGTPIALKDAYTLIAKSAGFVSWQAMKATVETHELLRPRQASALWSVWYGTYEEGKAHLDQHGGYLLPYQKQCFVCDTDYLASLGLQPGDPDLLQVGNDWVKPCDEGAYKRLLGKIKRQ